MLPVFSLSPTVAGDWCCTLLVSARKELEGPVCTYVLIVELCIKSSHVWQAVGFPLLLLTARHVGPLFAKY